MIYRFFILAIVGTTFGCYEPADLDLPPHNEQLVFFATLTPDSLVNATLTRTRGLGSQPLSPIDEFIADATIGISSEGMLPYVLTYVSPMESGDSMPAYKNSSFRPQIGQPYDLLIEAPGFDPVSASCIIPAPVNIVDVHIHLPPPIHVFNQLTLDTITGIGHLVIDDDPNTNNYYHLATADMTFDWLTPNPSGTFDTTYDAAFANDMALENIMLQESAFVSLPEGQGFLIDDSRLAHGAKVSFRVDVPWSTGWSYSNLRVELRHCDKAYFDFYYAWARQHGNDSQFDLAVPSKTNISNGQGYFSGYSISEAQVDFLPK